MKHRCAGFCNRTFHGFARIQKTEADRQRELAEEANEEAQVTMQELERLKKDN